MNEKKIAVIFDLDGTLLDTLDDLTDSVNHVISNYGFRPVSRENVRNFIGNGARLLVERSMYSKNGELDVEVADPELAKHCLDEFLVYYRKNLNVKTAPYPDLIDALECLYRNNIPMAVVSNKPDAAVKELCYSHFEKYFPIALGEVAGQPKKPDPTILYGVIKELGCDTAIYVGDSEPDIRVAENANVPSVLMTWGFRDKQALIDGGAEILADDASELLDALSRLLGMNFGE